ncbi:MAG: ABC transporter permease [Armatimonadota bacterium]|nr:ABC transporter permease [Armatimonadota bacterium]MDW8104172.1 ABC transporter permease [Armatimonadota bacterium]
MNFAENFQIALQSLLANKLRSALTMLGIIIGVGAVIAMISVAQGAREQTMQRIQQLGTNVLVVFPGQQRFGAAFGGFGSMQILKPEDVDAIRRSCPSVRAASPEVRRNAQAKYKNRNTNTNISGVAPEYSQIRNYPVQQGRFFNQREVDSMARVCVIGQTVYENLFNGSSALGKTIRIRGISFKVVGVLAPKGAQGFGNPDDIIFVPYTTAMRRLFGVDFINSISVQAVSEERMNAAYQEVEQLMRRRQRLNPGQENNFRIMNQAEFVQTAEDVSRTFTLLLAGIASVSLLVGGIGIMNIMLVSVTERTREIGIRKAVGAKRRDILLQFLIEAMTLSLVGGLIGIGAGLGAAYALGSTAGWQIHVTPYPILLAFGFSAAVGIFFGIYPAQKASALNPIEALRYE